MANKKRGYYSLKLGGKNRTLHFSMNFWSEFTDQLDVKLDQIGELFEGGLSLSAIRALVYSALLANDQENGNPIEYNIFTVGSWLDDLSSDELTNIINTMMESRLLGNDLNMGIDRNGSGNDNPTQ